MSFESSALNPVPLNSFLDKPSFTVYLIYMSVGAVLAGEAKEEKSNMQEIAA